MNRQYYYLSIVFIALISFVCGFLTPISSNNNIEPEILIKESVLDLLAYPKAASFRNISYHRVKKGSDGREIGFYCGEVFGFENELPYGYKRFFVTTLKQSNGDMNISIPIAEKIDDLLSQKEFDELWNIRCVK